MDKNVIQAFKKLDISYNPASLNYINETFKDIMLENASQEKELIQQEHNHFSVLLSSYGEPQNFQEAWHNKYPE